MHSPPRRRSWAVWGIVMDRARFRRLVQRAIDSLQRELGEALDNLAVVIEREPSRADLRPAGLAADEELFGLYLGVPLPERVAGGSVLPDRIVIYQGPLERAFHPRAIPHEVEPQIVRRILLHLDALHLILQCHRPIELHLCLEIRVRHRLHHPRSVVPVRPHIMRHTRRHSDRQACIRRPRPRKRERRISARIHRRPQGRVQRPRVEVIRYDPRGRWRTRRILRTDR